MLFEKSTQVFLGLLLFRFVMVTFVYIIAVIFDKLFNLAGIGALVGFLILIAIFHPRAKEKRISITGKPYA